MAQREGWTVTKTFCDNDRSASRYARKSRDDFENLIEYVRAGEVDVVITWEASRATRDLEVYVQLRELCRKNNVLWCYSGRVYDLSRVDDRLSTGLDALLAERESDMTRERVLRAVRANAATGKPHGRVKYGYKRTYDSHGEYVSQEIDEQEAAVLREVSERFMVGESFISIARDLTERGVSGKRWHPTNLSRLMRSPTYAGKRVHQGKIIGDGAWPAIFTEMEWYAMQNKLNDPQHQAARKAPKVVHLLSGLLTCGVCGSKRFQSQKQNGKYRAYVCVENKCVCRHEPKLDEFIEAVMVERLKRDDAVQMFRGHSDEGIQDVLDEIELKQARLNEFYDAAAAGELSAAALSRIEKTLTNEIAALQTRARQYSMSPTLKALGDVDVSAQWKTMSVSLKREIIRELIEDITVKRTKRGLWTLDPATVRIRWREQHDGDEPQSVA